MAIIEHGRADSMIKEYKDDNVKDIMRTYFNHPIWTMKKGDPVPDMPLDIQIELVNRCNLSCDACHPETQKRPKSFLEWEVLKRIVDETAKESICYFTICGIGEASLHPDLFKFLGYIRDKEVEVKGLRLFPMIPSILISNGNWSKKQVAECIENPPDVLSVSLAGLTDEEIKYRRRPLNLERFYENISTIYNNRKVVRDVDHGIVPIIHISTHIYPNEMVTRKEDIKHFKEKWFKICDAIVIKNTMINQGFKPFDKFKDDGTLNSKFNPALSKDESDYFYKRTKPCFETSRRLSIDSDGNIWCGHHRSENYGPYLGNIKKQTLHEVWHSDLMNEQRRQVRAGVFRRPACKGCGDEIRELHTDKDHKMEEVITFS